MIILGGGLEDQITLVLVKKGIIDCENDTQCDSDKACLDSNKERGRQLCEPVCERQLNKKVKPIFQVTFKKTPFSNRLDCPIQHAECLGMDHEASCECKEGFHGNGTDSCIPDGFSEEVNGN
jgi:hypothetical protein